MRGETGAFTVRDLETLEELEACVDLQEEVWGGGFSQRVPVSILKVSQRLGGVVAGAFDEADALVGFVYGLTGLEDGEVVHWSDMLAVRPGLRSGGLGRRLKAVQRDRCLELGVRRVYWTFDPLESRNAWLNLGRLGAVAREYIPDMYGSSNSPLHQGLGTDRLLAVWLLDSQRVQQRLAGTGTPPPSAQSVEHLPLAFTVELDAAFPRPLAPPHPPATPNDDGLLVPIPADIQTLKGADPALAGEWRKALRSALAGPLADGWEVSELVRTAEPISYYLLRPTDRR